MGSETILTLVVEDNPGDARLLAELTREIQTVSFELTHVDSLAASLAMLNQKSFDIILLDLGLPDSHGLEGLEKLRESGNQVPIVLLTGYNDEKMAITAMKQGAQDYLIKGQVTPELLVRSIRYSIERYQLLTELQARSFADELTGLYNRRGFFQLGAQQLNRARRENQTGTFIFMDMDGLKRINDTYGHQEGDKALQALSEIIRKSFRGDDLTARLGGDEFVIMLSDEISDIEPVITRMKCQIEDFNRMQQLTYDLSISYGMAPFSPDESHPLDYYLTKSDALMYEQKKEKKKDRENE